jgi:peptide deformylase
MMRLVPSYDPVLHKPTMSIKEEELPALGDVIAGMISVLDEKEALGLAAPQVGSGLNLFVMRWMGQTRVCINPQVIETSEETAEVDEGCLSYPNLRLGIKRPLWATVCWQDTEGSLHQTKLFGMEARIFLHEWDHCQGICFTDRVGKTTLLMAKKRAEKESRRKL